MVVPNVWLRRYVLERSRILYKLLKNIGAVLLWIPGYLIVEGPLLIIGAIRVWVHSGLYHYHPVWSSSENRYKYHWDKKSMWLWDNQEDGISGPEESNSPSTQRWIERTANWTRRKKIRSWCIFRNPVSNLRYSRWGYTMDRQKMEYWGSYNPWEDYKFHRLYNNGKGKAYICYARQGWRSGIWIVKPLDGRKHRIIRFGWKCYPGYYRPIDRKVAMTAQIRWKSPDSNAEESLE